MYIFLDNTVVILLFDTVLNLNNMFPKLIKNVKVVTLNRKS